jgi:predicted Fe-Mo cluster-binding NifX family protein
MKIALPVWEGKISPVFDTASKLLVLQLEEKEEKYRFEAHLHENDLGKRCSRLKNLDVDLLICGGISRQFYRMLTGSGIRVICWICGVAEDVLGAYQDGTLHHSKFRMPGWEWVEEENRPTDSGKKNPKIL